IKHTTNNVTPPPEACTTWKAMYNGINELIDDLMDHISLENNVLFPRALGLGWLFIGKKRAAELRK
ncbi:hemerythrin domain-containing protein, partial [Pseudomonas sp. SIMBA_065]